MEEVGVVILNYKKWNDTINCVDSFLDIADVKYKIFIVDNYSNNDSLEKIEDWWLKKTKEELFACNSISNCKVNSKRNFFLIQSLKNDGYSAGNNIGCKIAIQEECSLLLIQNPDTIVNPHFLKPLVLAINSSKSIAMVGPIIKNELGCLDYHCAKKRPSINDYLLHTHLFRIIKNKILNSNNKNRIFYKNGFYLGNHTSEVDIISGSCMLINANLFKEIGLFDDNNFLYLEELILCENFKKNNLKTLLVRASKIIHIQGSSTELIKSSYIKKHYLDSLKYYLIRYRRVNPIIVNYILLNMKILQRFW